MRRLQLVALFLACALALACDDPMQSGAVLAKKFEAAHAEEYSCEIGSVQVGEITVPIYGTCSRHVPDRWLVTLSGSAKDGSARIETISVPESLFAVTERGDELYRHGKSWEFEP